MSQALLALGVVAGLATLVWLWSLRRHDVSVADIFWPLYHVIVTAIFYFAGAPTGFLATAVFVLIAVWGLRLAYHIGRRQIGNGEDHRYTSVRESNDERFPYTSLYLIFLPQVCMAWAICLVVQPIFTQSIDVSWSQWLFFAVALSGLIFEVVADSQLGRFRAQMPSSAVLNSGLWKYTRHPNYFGEWVFWLGICGVSMHYSIWWPIIAMTLLSFLLMRMTGVKRMEVDIESRRPGYSAYVAQTSSFFPWRQLLIAGLVAIIVAPDIRADNANSDQIKESVSAKTEVWLFRVFIDNKEVGYHSFKAHYTASGIRLEGEAEFAYKVLGFTVFSYKHEVTEEYDNNFCLQKISSATRIKDKSLSLKGHKTAAGFAVNAAIDEIHDSQCLVPFAYWAPTFIAQNQLLNGQTGELVAVSIQPESQTDNFAETSYRVEADEMSLVVSYDADGKWDGLVSDLPAKRKLIYTLQTYETEGEDFLAVLK